MKLFSTSLVVSAVLCSGNFAFSQSSCFTSPNDFAFTGPTSGRSIDKGDFNNDGKQDIIIGNFTLGTNKVNLLMGNGNGTFLPHVTREGGSAIQDIRAFDFNADGNLDFVTVNAVVSPTISVVFGNGNGTFQAPVTYSTVNATPDDIELGDFNNDSKQDIVVSNLGGGFTLFLGSTVTPGAFSAGVVFTMGSGPRGIVAADLNGDTFLDVATTNTSSANVSVRFGNGAGGFGAAVDYATGAGCFHISSGDYNNDGDIDLATTNETANTVSVLSNNGSGVFTTVNYASGNGPRGIVSKDINADGVPDILVLNNLENSLAVFKAVGDGTFLPGVKTVALGTPQDIVTGNFNGDAYPDFAISNNSGSLIPVFLGNAAGTISSGNFFDTGNAPKALATNDFNGDGDPDIVVANSTDNTFTYCAGQAGATFATGVPFATGTLPVSIFSGDVNNDGAADVVTVNQTSNDLSVFLGNGSGNFSAATHFACNTAPTFVRLADINNDGNLDAIVINSSSNAFCVLNGTGTGSFGAPVSYATGTNPVALSVATMNADAFKDIVVVNRSSNNVSTFLNSGSGTFPSITNTTVTSPSAIDAGDINNDGTTDLLITNFSTSNITSLSNNGAGVLTAVVLPPSGDLNPTGIVLGDFDGDGNLDAMADFNASAVGVVCLFKGSASGSFTFTKKFSTGGTPLGIVKADFNADGRKDVAVVNDVTKNVAILLNATAKITPLGPTTFCSGGSVVLQSFPTTNYNWSTSATTQAITATTSGAYTVTTSEGISNWCSSTSLPATVTVTAGPATPTITPGGSTNVCAGGNVVLTSSAATGNTWSTGATTQAITVSTSGSYTVTQTSGGCTSSPSSAIVVTVAATPTISAGGPTTFCSGGSVVLTSSSATGNAWSTGETTQAITVTTSGNYTVTVTVPGCPAITSAAVTVTVNASSPTPTITPGGPTTFCAGGSVVLTSSAAINNTWSTGETTQSITVNTTGNYTVSATTGSCAAATSAPIAVTVTAIPTTPTITPGGPTTFCAGGNVVLTSSAATGNLWSNGATTQSITVSTAGNYTVTTTSSGCTSPVSAATAVTVNPIPATPTITASGATIFCTGGNVILTSSAATGNLWSTGETTQAITVNTSGNYTVAVTENGCTSATSSATAVIVNPIPTTPTVTAGSATTFCAGGNVVLTSSATTGNLWSNGATTQSITVSTAGSYDVTVTTAGCTSAVSNSVDVIVNPIPTPPTITASGATTFCQGDSVVLTSSEATGNTWSTGETTQTITVNTSGNYTVSLTANGCTSSASTPRGVTVNPIPTIPTITASGSTTLCAGGSVVLTSSSVANNVWSTGATTQSITVSTAGNYSVEVIASGCASGISAATTVIVNPIPVTPTITASSATTFCQGDSVVLTSSETTGNLWSTGETTQTITVNTSGNYTATIAENGCISPNSNTITILVNPIPAVPTITASGSTTLCAGDSVVLTSSSATDNNWSTGETTQSITVSTAGNYSVEVIASGCASGISAATTVIVNPIPVTPSITAGGATTFCQGDSVVLTSSEITGNIWSTIDTTQSITITTSGNYTVAITENGCTSPSSNTISVTAVAPPTIIASGPTIFCDGDSITLTSSEAFGNTWSTGDTTAAIVVTNTGSYTVTAVLPGCPAAVSDPTVVIVNKRPITPTISASGDTTFCQGDSVVLTSSDAIGNTWSTGDTTASITATVSGSYTVFVTDGNGCNSLLSPAIDILVNPLPANPFITANGPLSFCDGGNVVLTSSETTGNLWSTGDTTVSITVDSSEVINVSYTDGNGCMSSSSDITITAFPAVPTPTITATGPTTFCAGGNTVLTSSAGTGNTWSTGETTQSITVTTTGNYTVSVISTDGCPSLTSSATSVTVNPLPAAPTITAGGPTTFCDGGTVTLTSSEATGNTWSTASTSAAITVSSSGSYTVFITDGNGCNSPASVAIDVIENATPTQPVITSSGPVTFCAGDSVVLSSSSATGNLWSTGATTQSITVSTAGNYTVVYTDVNSCASPSSATTTITVNPIPAAPIVTAGGATTFCSGNSVVLSSSEATGNLWSTGATTQTITVALAGSYSATTTVAGCTSAASTPVSITVNPTPAAPTITPGGPTTFCAGGNVVLTSSSATGNTWSTGETTQSITVNSSGNYTATVQSGSCTSAAATPVTVAVGIVPATPTITAGGPTTFCTGSNVVLTSSAATGNNWSTGETTQSITVSAAGSYSITAISIDGCPSGTTTIAVNVHPVPAAPTIAASGPTTFCTGDNVVLTAPASVGYNWSNGQTTQSITVSTSGTYAVSTINASGCSSAQSADVTVTANPLPATPNITTSGSLSFCAGQNVVLTSSSGTGNIWSTGEITQSITVSTAGNYSVKVIDGNNCNSGIASANVSVIALPSTPVISAGGPLTFCAGENVVLTAPASAGYNWSNGQTTQSITASTSGTYTVSTVNGGGCSSAASSGVTVTVNPIPSTPLIIVGGSTTICEGASTTLTSTSTANNVWSTGQTTQAIAANASGTYTVHTVVLGCSSANSAPVTLVVNPAPTAPVITASGPLTICAGQPLFLFSSAASGNLWSNNETTASIAATTTGSYTVTATNGNGCSAVSAPVNVVVHAIPTVSLTDNTQLCVSSAPYTLVGGVPSGGVYSGTGVTNGILNPATVGNNTVIITYTYTDANGCTNTALNSLFVDNCLGLEEKTQNMLTAYPNPSDGHFTIVSEGTMIEHWILFDGSGKRVAEMKNDSSSPLVQLDFSMFANGVYNLEVNEGTTAQRHVRLIINK